MGRRLSRRLGLGILGALACVVLAVVGVRRCDARGGGERASARDPGPATVVADPASQGDPLLAEARSRIEGGRIPEDVASALLASDEPAHQRARRLLAAMREPAEPEQDEEVAAVAPLAPPKIRSETAGSEVAPVPSVPDEASPGVERSPSAPSKPSAKRRSGRASLSGISLREHARGATLTLHATGGVVAGVANQPRSGIVRLVVQSSGAAHKVLSARPRVSGARVTSVRAGTDTVIVTLELEPGWSLGTIERTSGGARIHLRRPD